MPRIVHNRPDDTVITRQPRGKALARYELSIRPRSRRRQLDRELGEAAPELSSRPRRRRPTAAIGAKAASPRGTPTSCGRLLFSALALADERITASDPPRPAVRALTGDKLPPRIQCPRDRRSRCLGSAGSDCQRSQTAGGPKLGALLSLLQSREAHAEAGQRCDDRVEEIFLNQARGARRWWPSGSSLTDPLQRRRPL